MNIAKLMKSASWCLHHAADRFCREVRGVAAVEFAFIAPIMLLLFVGTIELSAGVSTNRKLSRVSSAIGDLVTQSQQLTPGDVDAIMDVAAKVMYPYSDQVDIVITSIRIDGSNNATVDWSRANPSSLKKSAGAAYNVPTKIKKSDTYLVAAQVMTSYTPSFGWAHYSAADGLSFSRTPIAMSEEIFLRPRIGQRVACVPASC